MKTEKVECKECGSKNLNKNGETKAGKQKYTCKDCGKNFVFPPREKTYSKPEKRLLSMLINLIELKPGDNMTLHQAFDKIKFERKKLRKFKLIEFKERPKGNPLTFTSTNLHMLISIDKDKNITLTKFSSLPFDDGEVLNINNGQVKITNLKR